MGVFVGSHLPTLASEFFARLGLYTAGRRCGGLLLDPASNIKIDVFHISYYCEEDCREGSLPECTECT